jgi:hypothetical protein
MAGASLLLVDKASASTGAADMTGQMPRQEIALYEEEIADVSLATFHVFDRETQATERVRLAQQRAPKRCNARGCAGCTHEALRMTSAMALGITDRFGPCAS